MNSTVPKRKSVSPLPANGKRGEKKAKEDLQGATEEYRGAGALTKSSGCEDQDSMFLNASGCLYRLICLICGDKQYDKSAFTSHLNALLLVITPQFYGHPFLLPAFIVAANHSAEGHLQIVEWGRKNWPFFEMLPRINDTLTPPLTRDRAKIALRELEQCYDMLVKGILDLPGGL